MTQNHDVLFDEFAFDGVSLDNRVGLAPMTRASATEDGRATERMTRYYAKFARGGFGFLVTEGTYVDQRHSQGYLNQPGLATDEQVDAWEQVTEAVHDEGSPILAQLMHAGALSQGNPHADETVAPSAVQPVGEQSELYGGEGEFATPRELTVDELDEIRDSFVESAKNAHDAGFDGVELHAANGYLLNEFIARDANQRDDEYGGSTENRVRYPAEVVDSVREELPDEFVVGVRVSQTKTNDGEYEWKDGADDAAVVFSALADAGADFVHVTDPDITAPAFGEDGQTFAEFAVEHAETTVVANGGLGDPDDAAAVVEATGADLVTVGKSALSNPDWPQQVEAGEDLDPFDFENILLPQATLSDHEIPDESVAPAND
ncbi:tRNA-dihydrouridine synthase [Haloarchaeobius sp. TZWWS8]|uniref:oxidoreductase n=1 Tax=Haloarchaeobius sp. TZWWS8 TaxID=3446121 RepID=UPI003EBA1E13